MISFSLKVVQQCHCFKVQTQRTWAVELFMMSVGKIKSNFVCKTVTNGQKLDAIKVVRPRRSLTPTQRPHQRASFLLVHLNQMQTTFAEYIKSLFVPSKCQLVWKAAEVGGSCEKALMFKGSDKKARRGGKRKKRNDFRIVKEIVARCRLLDADNCASH